jgi:hypothetical protein
VYERRQRIIVDGSLEQSHATRRVTESSAAIDRRPLPYLAALQLHEIELGIGKEARCSPELGLRKRNRCPLPERNAGQWGYAIAAHGMKRQRGDGERIREIVRRKGDSWRGLSIESDAGGVDETLWRCIQSHRQRTTGPDNVGELREHQRRSSYEIRRLGDGGDELGQTVSAELRANGYR